MLVYLCDLAKTTLLGGSEGGGGEKCWKKIPFPGTGKICGLKQCFHWKVPSQLHTSYT
jgi:hypothetical protein